MASPVMGVLTRYKQAEKENREEAERLKKWKARVSEVETQVAEVTFLKRFQKIRE